MLLDAPVQAVDLQAKLFRGLGDASRLAILAALAAGPLTVTEIVQATGMSQPNVSNHLGCLRGCGLVAAEPRGRFVDYRLSDPRVAQLLSLADELLHGVAQGMEQCPHYAAEPAGSAVHV